MILVYSVPSVVDDPAKERLDVVLLLCACHLYNRSMIDSDKGSFVCHEFDESMCSWVLGELGVGVFSDAITCLSSPQTGVLFIRWENGGNLPNNPYQHSTRTLTREHMNTKKTHSRRIRRATNHSPSPPCAHDTGPQMEISH